MKTYNYGKNLVEIRKGAAKDDIPKSTGHSEESRNIMAVPDRMEIEEVTLLSKEEYTAFKRAITPIENCWWLRSPGKHSNLASFVYPSGTLSSADCYTRNSTLSVRPAIKFKSANLKKKDSFSLGGCTWTVISDEIALCSEGVGTTCFRKDWMAADANLYEASDIKMWLQDWAKTHGITCTESP